ncbi:DNA topoisomerase [Streptococcus anginosus]|uniref:type IA DNA topoisomerase n=1 Tax=Streptococcus anginosus TaxID=1328 RepID=UPI0021F8A12E|nr:DNA topoisomerase [Streptococcus anginosus]MCW1051727.1 DNA topoisomerase [Streptococcus anginosus]
MVIVVLAEKEKQAEAYATALGQFRKKKGVYVIRQSPYFPVEVHVVAAEGHLFEYSEPDNWSLDKLPLTNVSFKQHLKEDKDSREKFKRIYDEVVAADQVIIGTDADREGERIGYSILSHIPGGKEKIWKRLWASSMTKKTLQKAFQELKEPSETYNYYLEAEARAQSDWLVGMNLSPLATIDLQARGQLPRTKGSHLSVGRVQTPAVRLVCENDLEIRNFTPEKYWKLQLEDKKNGVFFTTKDKTKDSEAILASSRGLSTTSVISSVEVENHQKSAPQLFTLSALQSFAASAWKFDSDKTESIVEGLYLEGFLSYPRPDSEYINQFEFDDLKENLSAYQKAINCHFEPAFLEPREDYVNGEKVSGTSHSALIPTERIPNLSNLKTDQRLIYEAVVKQAILMFADDCYYSTKTIEVENSGLVFKTKGRTLHKLGWAEWSSRKVRGSVEVPDYQVGDRIETQVQIVGGETKPPKRLTESQLIGQIFPKYGLGTQATRGEIIKKIQSKGYVVKDKKTGQLTPTNKAYLLINYLYDNEFSDPETTGGWEMFLSQIGEGTINPREFVDAIKDKLTLQIKEVKERGD